MRETVDQICADLREGNRAAVKRVVAAIGADQTLALLMQALELVVPLRVAFWPAPR